MAGFRREMEKCTRYVINHHSPKYREAEHEHPPPSNYKEKCSGSVFNTKKKKKSVVLKMDTQTTKAEDILTNIVVALLYIPYILVFLLNKHLSNKETYY